MKIILVSPVIQPQKLDRFPIQLSYIQLFVEADSFQINSSIIAVRCSLI